MSFVAMAVSAPVNNTFEGYHSYPQFYLQKTSVVSYSLELAEVERWGNR
jgi:hypothetical protein